MTDVGQKNKKKKHCSKMSTALQGLWLTERERERAFMLATDFPS